MSAGGGDGAEVVFEAAHLPEVLEVVLGEFAGDLAQGDLATEWVAGGGAPV